MSAVNGREYKLYTTDDAPAAPTTLSDYDMVALLTDLSINGTRAAIDKSSKDDGDESTFIAGRRNHTISGTAFYDAAGDAGQEHFKSEFDAVDGLIYFCIANSVVGEKAWHGSGIVTTWTVTFPDEGVAQVDFEIQVSGALTEFEYAAAP